MNKEEIIEMPDFEYTPQGFAELKAALKAGMIVKNPFAKFYGDKIEVNIIQDTIITEDAEASFLSAR